MSSIEHSLAVLRRAHDRVGSRKLADVSGVPYTTVREAASRGFGGKTVEALIALVAAAEEIEASEAAA